MPVTSKRKRELGVHGGVHHADAAQEQHDLAARQRPGDEFHTVGLVARGVGQARLQHLPFRLEGGHNRNARRGIEPPRTRIGRLQRQREKRQQQAQGGSNESHGGC
jgi:hypothetical protein